MPNGVEKFLTGAEREINKAQQFLADLTQARHEVANAPRTIFEEVTQTVTETRRDVRRAAALQQMLPVAIGAVGVIAGQPVLGIGAALAVAAVGKQASA